jgi:hypothetical protein
VDAGLVLFVDGTEVWNLTYNGTLPAAAPVASDRLPAAIVPTLGNLWHTLNLTTLGKTASASYVYSGNTGSTTASVGGGGGVVASSLFASLPRRDLDTGFDVMSPRDTMQSPFR